MKGHIRVATKEDAAQIFELRLKEYTANKKDWELKHPDHLNWSELDNNGIVLGAWCEDGRLLSTMAAIIVGNKETTENLLELRVPETVLQLSLILRRAATDHDARHLGLNTLLRYYFFKTLDRSDVKNVLGQVYKGAPRTKTLLELGYSIIDLGFPEERDFVNKSVVELAILQSSLFESATQKLHELNKGVVDDFPYVGKEVSYI